MCTTHLGIAVRCKKNAATQGRSVPIVEVSLSTRNFSGKRGKRTLILYEIILIYANALIHNN